MSADEVAKFANDFWLKFTPAWGWNLIDITLSVWPFKDVLSKQSGIPQILQSPLQPDVANNCSFWLKQPLEIHLVSAY